MVISRDQDTEWNKKERLLIYIFKERKYSNFGRK
jgi:hypothetical protein